MARRRSGAVLCSSCRQLISVHEAKCPYCGALRPALWGYAPSLRRLYAGELDLVGLIVAACAGLYLLSLALDPSEVLRPAGLFSIGSPSSRALWVLGMTGGIAQSCGYWWTLLSAGFLHGSLLHIAFNLMWIRDLGPTAVHLFGPARFFAVYSLSGAAGFAFSNLVPGIGGSPTVGASAAIFGLLGALAGFGRRRGGTLGAHLSLQMFRWGAVIFAMGFMARGVNNLAHAGGFVAGFAIAWLLPRHEGRREGRWVQVLALALLVATAGAIAASVVTMWPVLATGVPPCVARLHGR